MAAVETCSQESYLTEDNTEIATPSLLKNLHHNAGISSPHKHANHQNASILVKAARSLNAQEWVLIFGALVSLYLINGAYAAVICSLTTSVPAVVHSYRIITEDSFRPEAYQATLCYWILLGALTGFDHLLGNAFAYYFIKFLLMSMVYTHMVTKSRPSYLKSSSADLYSMKTSVCPNASSEVTKQKTADQLTEYCVSSNPTGAPLTSKDSSLANYVNWKLQRESEAAAALENEKGDRVLPVHAGLYDETVHSAGECLKTEKREHDGGDAGASVNFFSPAPSHFDEVLMNSGDSGAVSDFAEAQMSVQSLCPPGEEKFASSQTTIYSTDWDRTLTGLTLNKKPSMTSVRARRPIVNESHETIPVFEGDIEANPDGLITFKFPFTDMHKISLTNVTSRKMLWALKTNAMDRILASPTCGLLPAGSTLRLKVAVRETAKIPPNDCGHDRIAIDYTFVEQQMYAFDPGYLVDHRNEFRRRAFPINYTF